MCGIAGYADLVLEPAAATDLLQRMCAVIRHRGPDDEGLYADDRAGLGMRRLSIIDVATGSQPIHNEDRTVSVVFNGEIYNYRMLRADLESRGHRFATSSDTETIVHGYEEWGEDVFARLRGMFGIAIWDARRKTLLLARDRAGIKPLHFAVAGGALIFGSEIKSILETGLVAAELDPAALDHYLSFLYTPRHTSIFAGVRKLEPGHLLRWERGRLTERRYWELPAEATTAAGRSEAETAEALREVLRDAVRSHLMSEVPLGAFLSGGIDSSLVVALMAEASAQAVKTFSIGFDEPEFDELEEARVVASHFATDHHEYVVRPDALGMVDKLITHFDEPFGDPSAIPTWYVSEIAARHVTVVLSGDGGDELFGGYDRYLPHPRVAAFDRWAPPGSRRLAALVWPWLPYGLRGKNFLRRVSLNAHDRYLDEIGHFQPDEKDALLSPDVRRRLGGAKANEAVAPRFERFNKLPWHGQLMGFDFETYLPGDILTKVDRTSMAHSIESRVPLLDNEVIDFAARLPVDLKIREGRRKYILKRAATGLLPESVLHRRKKGFGVPVGMWFRGGLRELFVDVLLSQRARQRGYFNVGFIQRLVGEHLDGTRDHTWRLWALLIFELWHRQYLDSRSAQRQLVA